MHHLDFGLNFQIHFVNLTSLVKDSPFHALVTPSFSSSTPSPSIILTLSLQA